MNKTEAKRILSGELESFRSQPHSKLKLLIDAEPFTKQCTGDDGKTYQIEVAVVWDDKPEGNIRVLGQVDDGGWRAFMPLCEDFIKSPSNAFVGE